MGAHPHSSEWVLDLIHQVGLHDVDTRVSSQPPRQQPLDTPVMSVPLHYVVGGPMAMHCNGWALPQVGLFPYVRLVDYTSHTEVGCPFQDTLAHIHEGEHLQPLQCRVCCRCHNAHC